MKTKLCKLVILVVIIKTVTHVRTENSFCRGNSNNCSQLVENEETCYMYRHAACMAFNFSGWTTQSITKITTEKDAGFDVTIFAYKNVRPAYNVTIMHSSPGIEGFFMELTDLGGKYDSCRIFDFRNPERALKIPFRMYYDCYNQLNRDSIYKYLLTVRSLPHNKQLVYEMNVPFIVNEEIGCDSETLIMVLVNSIHENKIAIKFQKISSKSNALQYEVKLVRTKPLGFSKIKTLHVNPADDKRMISVTFESLDKGIYNLSIEPFHKGRNCRVTFLSFSITKELPNYEYVGWLVGGIVFVLLACAVVYYTIRKKLTSILIPKLRKILIVYHPDNREFINLVNLCITSYLESFIPAIVFIDSKLVNEDAADWIIKSFNSSDIIMIILSNGITTNIIDIDDPPPYGSLFWSTYNHIYHEIIMNEESRSKIYIKVYFEKTYDVSNIPEKLKLSELGPNYKLMKDFKKVFCRLKGVSSFWSLFIQPPNIRREEVDAALLELI